MHYHHGLEAGESTLGAALIRVLMNPGNPYLAAGMALGHQQLTHRSEMVSSGLSLLVPALLRVVNGRGLAGKRG